jgi:P-type Cu+ transporter
METKIFKIEGMTCVACAKAVEKAAIKIDGVTECTVNFATEKLKLTFDADKLDLPKLKKSIEKMGYKIFDDKNDMDADKQKKEAEIKSIWSSFVMCIIFAIPLLIFAMVPMKLMHFNIYIPSAINPLKHPIHDGLIQLALTTPIMYITRGYFKAGFRALYMKSPNMDSLIAIGTSSAYIYSIYQLYTTFGGNTKPLYYFEVSAVILTMVVLGKYLEAISKGKMSEAIKKLMGLAPKTAIIIKDQKEVEINIDEVKVLDIIVVKPGSKMPVDGEVVFGTTSVDESMITGESIPVEKNIGDKIVGASINKNGLIHYKATKVGEDTALAQIIKLVEDAQNSKAPISKLADLISAYFVPIVMVIATLSGLSWYIFAGQSVAFSISIFISVLVIACPCALGLATPTAIIVGTSKGAENGILIKSGDSLETAHKVKTIVFDKTGTITEGKPKVTDIITSNSINEDSLLQIAASAEKGSEHPLGEAIVKKFEEKGLEFLEIKSFKAITGFGIEVFIDEKYVVLGNKKLMVEKNIPLNDMEEASNKLAIEGKTPMYVAIDGVLSGIIAVADTVKESSSKAIEVLKSMDIKVIMITGDNTMTANAIAKQVGIDTILAEVLPKDKANEIKNIQNKGVKVAMVGDGINDAPALAQANIGIAIGTGTDVAIESADIVLMKSDLMDVATSIKLSKKTIGTIKQNLFWAFAYNVLGIPIAMGVLYIFGGPLLNPMIAAIAMSLSSVSVLINTLRLRKFEILK